MTFLARFVTHLAAPGFFFLLGSVDRRAYRAAQLRGLRIPRCLGVLPDLGRGRPDPDQSAVAAHCVHQIRNHIEVLRKEKTGFVLAVTSPYQAAVRADVQKGDRCIILGVTGGLGVFMSQILKAMGAEAVVGIARHPDKLERALDYGTDYVINSTDKSVKDIRNEFRELCKANGLNSKWGWKIFEMTGARPAQEIALGLLSFVGKLVWVGFSTNKNEYSLSRLMAFDAEIIGSWGCLPEYYPTVLKMILDGKVELEPFVETRPMSQIADVFEEAHSTTLMRRIVLTPDF